MELSNKAYITYLIMKRETPLMDGLQDATDEDILKVCREIVRYLESRGINA